MILKVLGLFMELRVRATIEDQGLDVHEHGEEAYSEDFGGGISVGEKLAS